MSYFKQKILFVNIIAILYKASALNVHRLHSDLREVKVVVNTSKQEIWIRQLFILLIASLLLIRFLMCFVGVASNIIAIYPILTNSQPELLMPSIIVQILDNVALNIYEVVLGYACLKYLHPESFAVFLVFLTKLVVRTTCCVSMLNLYAEKHHHLSAESGALESESSEEFEIEQQHLMTNPIDENHSNLQ